jgi:predicted nucleic acid-binding protein
VILYLDSSALLRIVLREKGALDASVLHDAESVLSSELIAIECPRTVDRLRLQGSLPVEEAAERTRAIKEWIEAVDLVLLQRPILARASEPLPTPLGTLDAIHLATALVWKDREGQELTMATHDGGLAIAARTFGIPVLGD